MKLLNGLELAGYIKERQARDVRALRQAWHVQPKLAIIVTADTPAITTYVRAKQKYGADILVDVDVHQVAQKDVPALIKKLNADDGVQGVIVQLPLADPAETDKLVDMVAPHKDVEALGQKAAYDPATPMAILWLLAGYNVSLPGKRVLLVGCGKLVGAPLERLLRASGVDVQSVDQSVADLKAETLQADVIITATGQPGLIQPDMIKPSAVVIDAGVAGEQGKTVGNVAPDVYQTREDITITPQKGGVGPLTVCALFENVIRAARATTKKPATRG